MLGPLADRMTSLQESPELALFVYTEERPHEDKERDGCPRARAGVGGLTRTRAASFPRRARPVSTQPPELRGSNARRLRRQHVRSSRSGQQPLRRPPCSEPGSPCPAQGLGHSERSGAPGTARGGGRHAGVGQRHAEGTGRAVGSDRQSRVLQRGEEGSAWLWGSAALGFWG